jgi:phage gp37-like protein
MIAAIEDNIIGVVKAVIGGRLRTVDSLPGDWDADLLKRLLLCAPAVYVAFLGGPKLKETDTVVGIDGRWSLFAITGHASGNAARRRGDGREIGAYEIIERLVPALHNHTVPDVGAMKLVNVENLYSGTIDNRGVALYAAVFTLPMYFPEILDSATLATFATFHADWDLAPADDAIDAADHVTLEQP